MEEERGPRSPGHGCPGRGRAETPAASSPREPPVPVAGAGCVVPARCWMEGASRGPKTFLGKRSRVPASPRESLEGASLSFPEGRAWGGPGLQTCHGPARGDAFHSVPRVPGCVTCPRRHVEGNSTCVRDDDTFVLMSLPDAVSSLQEVASDETDRQTDRHIWATFSGCLGNTDAASRAGRVPAVGRVPVSEAGRPAPL